MNVRIPSMLAAALVALCPTAAMAAVTVLGGGPAVLCYQAADQGLPAADNLIYCNLALSGPLTPRDRAATYVNRGVLKLGERRYEDAASDFNAGLAINDRMGEGYVDLGATEVGRRLYADAVTHITRGLTLGTKQPQVAYFDRAMAHEALGEVRAAYDDYRQALSVAPDFKPASNELKRFTVTQKPSGT
ncbi:MAG TPA: hypothetical protein VGB91_10225 [Rhizomicrobium sp.]